MNTYTVATAVQAHFLRNLHTESERVMEEAQNASRRLLDIATQVGEGQGAVLDFSASHVAKYQEALAKREALLTMVNAICKDVPTEALMAAAQAEKGAWFDSADR